jgi:hypothetical protein
MIPNYFSGSQKPVKSALIDTPSSTTNTAKPSTSYGGFSYDPLKPKVDSISMNSNVQPAVKRESFFDSIYKPELGINFDKPIKKEGTDTDTPWYQNGEALQGYADLAGIGLGLAQYFEDRKTGNLQRKGLEQNIAKVNTDNKFQALARSNLNASMVNKNTTGVT